MKIALIGYGKMGKAIEDIAVSRKHTIHARVNSAEELPLAKGADCCIEFTQPSAAFGNLKFCAQNNLPVVCGTTAWYDRYDELKAIVNEETGALLTATNFSIGVNIFFKINEELARIMNRFPEYEVSMEETHHLQKLDHPSGTATTLSEGITQNSSQLNHLKAYLDGETKPTLAADEFSILCKREPEVPGTHSIKYSSQIDDIFIEHKAHNRTGFATGAVFAAEWLVDKKGVYTMTDVLGI
jgi:4-hydroxy-tetrahydrodipicolinate reductase